MTHSELSHVELVPREKSHAAVELMVRAFHNDPTCGWIFQCNSKNYSNRLRAFFEAGNEDHFLQRQPVFGLFVERQIVGAAYVLKPGASITPWSLLRWLAVTREMGCAFRLLRYFFAVQKREPEGRHYTIVIVGIDLPYQRQGYGAALMRAVHVMADEDGDADGIVLDTGNPQNISFYAQLGYTEIANCQLGLVCQRVMHRYRVPN